MYMITSRNWMNFQVHTVEEVFSMYMDCRIVDYEDVDEPVHIPIRMFFYSENIHCELERRRGESKRKMIHRAAQCMLWLRENNWPIEGITPYGRVEGFVLPY